MDVKGFVFCQQHSSTSHDYPVDSHREDRAKKVEDEKRQWAGYKKKAVWEKGEWKVERFRENNLSRFNY